MRFAILTIRFLTFVTAVCTGVICARAQESAQGGTMPAENATPAWEDPLERLNTKLPSWIQFSGVYRVRGEDAGHRKFTTVQDAYMLSRLRLMMTLRPASWFSIVAESTDARDVFNTQIPSAPPYQNTWEVWQAYAQLGSDERGWFDVKAGRQVLSFGDERVIGPSNWTNHGRSFDAIRLDLHPEGYLVSVFASSVAVARDGVLDHHIQGNNLHGIYASAQKLIPKSTVEPYILWRTAPAWLKLGENAGRGALDEKILGLRWAGKLPGNFDYGMELNKELGTLGPDSISAWAGYWTAGYTFANLAIRPRAFVELNYASGTKDPTSSSWGTFDQVYPSAHDKLGFADQVGRRNIRQFRVGASQKFGRKWSVKEQFADFWLASARDALYGNDGTPVVQSLSGTAGTHVGEEFDIVTTYDWNKVTQFGFGYGHVFTGEVLNRLTPGKDYNYPFAYLEYKF